MADRVTADRRRARNAPAAHSPVAALEPLSEAEIEEAVRLARAAEPVPADARVVYVTLHEPVKGESAAAADAAREAEVLLLDRLTGRTLRVVAALGTDGVASVDSLDGVQPPILLEEFEAAANAIRADARWREALLARGITEFDSVQIDPWVTGNFGHDFEHGRRIVRGVSYLRHDPSDNGYAHPIEGVLAFVDLNSGEVVRVEDHGPVVLPEEDGRYDAESVGQLRSGLRPLEIHQPDGPSFDVSGHEVRWQRWRLRIAMHPIEGLVLHQVRYQDGARERMILHRASLSEMVVPYGETSPMHYWKNAFDAGEYGLGKLANSLELGCDCLGEIRYLDAVMADEDGNPVRIPNAICLHEEDHGILWKHEDFLSGSSEVRRSRRLVVSSIHTVGNYEYGFFWYFYLDGAIEVEVKLTGILQTMAVAPKTRPRHSELVAPSLAAPHHQHLFNFRLDFDLDGTSNAVYEVDVERTPGVGGLAEGTAFAARSTLLQRELDARRDTEPSRARHWKVVNRGVRNRLGEPVGYRIVPGDKAARLLADADSSVGRRAAFARHNLWVTPYRPDELHAAGDFPNQHPGGDGLPRWTQADRDVTDTDLVVWLSVGTTHLARPEDWPVMPVEYVGFRLQPDGFFDRNPALDLPRPAAHCERAQETDRDPSSGDERSVR